MKKKNELAKFLLDVGAVAGIIGGAYFARKKGYGFGGRFAFSLLFAAPFVTTRIIMSNKSEPSTYEKLEQDMSSLKKRYGL